MGKTERGKLSTINIDKKEIIHFFPTEKGASGAPLIWKEGDSFNIIGIHKGKKKQNDEVVKHARLITPDLIQKLKL